MCVTLLKFRVSFSRRIQMKVIKMYEDGEMPVNFTDSVKETIFKNKIFLYKKNGLRIYNMSCILCILDILKYSNCTVQYYINVKI